MIKYIVKRLFYAILTLLVLVALTFFMMRLLPGDPFIGEKAIPETTLKALNEKYGLDKPMMTQFIMYLKIYSEEILVSQWKVGVL